MADNYHDGEAVQSKMQDLIEDGNYILDRIRAVTDILEPNERSIGILNNVLNTQTLLDAIDARVREGDSTEDLLIRGAEVYNILLGILQDAYYIPNFALDDTPLNDNLSEFSFLNYVREYAKLFEDLGKSDNEGEPPVTPPDEPPVTSPGEPGTPPIEHYRGECCDEPSFNLCCYLKYFPGFSKNWLPPSTTFLK